MVKHANNTEDFDTFIFYSDVSIYLNHFQGIYKYSFLNKRRYFYKIYALSKLETASYKLVTFYEKFNCENTVFCKSILQVTKNEVEQNDFWNVVWAALSLLQNELK